MFCAPRQFLDKVYLLLQLFFDFLKEKWETCLRCLEKSKNLHGNIISVCSIEEKVSTKFEKVFMHLLYRGTHISHMS